MGEPYRSVNGPRTRPATDSRAEKNFDRFVVNTRTDKRREGAYALDRYINTISTSGSSPTVTEKRTFGVLSVRTVDK
jgi:hypothetical protein